MQSLFERISDAFDGTAEAITVKDEYLKLRLTFLKDGPDNSATKEVVNAEVFAYAAVSLEGAHVPLVRVQCEDGPPVLVSPIPSAILAVALR